MQFSFNCEQILGCNNEGFAFLEGSFQGNIRPAYSLLVNEILDTMGTASSKVTRYIFTQGPRVEHNHHNSFQILFFTPQNCNKSNRKLSYRFH